MANFRNKKSIAAYEAATGKKVFVHSHKSNSNIFLFSHSADPEEPAEGLVSKQAIAHLRAGGDKTKLMVADCDYTDNDGVPQTCKMVMMSVTSNCGALLFSL